MELEASNTEESTESTDDEGLDLIAMPDDEIEETLEEPKAETKEEEETKTILMEEQNLFEDSEDLPSPEEADAKRDFSENL